LTTPGTPAQKLSTDRSPVEDHPVDKYLSTTPCPWRLGLVVPKRHARRAVMRSLLKRQMRSAMQRHAVHMPHGMWVLRLRCALDAAQFPAAASGALRRALRTELDTLLAGIQAPASTRAQARP
jgi:ribonuclease P protein component